MNIQFRLHAVLTHDLRASFRILACVDSEELDSRAGVLYLAGRLVGGHSAL